ncbi:DUF3240 family protein [Alteromonas facilis]|uniref:DUF3240 family protein n=1 Tax=Alteromonas facilis TaxID=2048004 RepID=UPI000C282F67|nr:DUF3240 family protein [Alteromonas facilis]
MSDHSLLSVFVEQALRDSATDALMGMPKCSGFSISSIDGFSCDHAKYDLREQVAGYRKMVRIDVMHHVDDLQSILAALAEIHSEHPLRYWVTPIIQTGFID